MPTWLFRELSPAVSYVALAALAVLTWIFVIAPVWRLCGSATRVAILATVYLVICSIPLLFVAGRHKWESLTATATALAAITALFYNEIQKLAHTARIAARVDNGLIEFAHGARWIRGKIENVGDRAVKRCRVKLLGVEGNNIQAVDIKSGYFQWQGGINGTMRLSPTEDWIFDLGIRQNVQDSAVELWTYVVNDNRLIPILPPGEYSLKIAIYGDNIRSQEQRVLLSIGAAPDQIQIRTL
jgi:hypothetical protein